MAATPQLGFCKSCTAYANCRYSQDCENRDVDVGGKDLPKEVRELEDGVAYVE
jgi:hypothetical protein